jgi:hypothetical protein
MAGWALVEGGSVPGGVAGSCVLSLVLSLVWFVLLFHKGNLKFVAIGRRQSHSVHHRRSKGRLGRPLARPRQRSLHTKLIWRLNLTAAFFSDPKHLISKSFSYKCRIGQGRLVATAAPPPAASRALPSTPCGAPPAGPCAFAAARCQSAGTPGWPAPPLCRDPATAAAALPLLLTPAWSCRTAAAACAAHIGVCLLVWFGAGRVRLVGGASLFMTWNQLQLQPSIHKYKATTLTFGFFEQMTNIWMCVGVEFGAGFGGHAEPGGRVHGM